KLPLMGSATGQVQALCGGTPGRSPLLCSTAFAIGRGGVVDFTASTLLGSGHAARICCRDRAISCPGMSSRQLTALSISSEIFGGTVYVATLLSPTLSERVRGIIRLLPSHVTSAVGKTGIPWSASWT